MTLERKQTDLLKKAVSLAQELNAILSELASSSNETVLTSTKIKPIFSEQELKADFERLRSAVENGEDEQTVVDSFLKNIAKERLNAFIKVNGLPIVAKKSKTSIASQLTQLLRQSKAIGARVRSSATTHRE